jgi:HK97 family phage portal protein
MKRPLPSAPQKVWDAYWEAESPSEPLQERSDFPDRDTQIANLRRNPVRPWHLPDIREALGVPAILGAVSLISNTVGSLSLEGFRNEVLLDDAPRLIMRPNPFSTPRAFFRDTAFYLATRGEAWWWVAARDIDGLALSLYPVPPWEVTVEDNPRNRLDPFISWLGKRLPTDDMRHLTYLPDGLRGMGPLQLGQAATSVTVEANNWAANFFSGNLPSMIGSTDQQMTEEELAALDAQWLEKPANLPRWLTLGMEMKESPFDAQKAQLSEARMHQVGEVARLFEIPGQLLEFNIPGSSLHYQNDEGVWADFQRRCLTPQYLTPIEQEMSDLLPRSLKARFNLKQLLRADAKARAEVHKTFIDAGVYGPEVAAREEGYAPGNVDFAPVLPSPPAAIPAQLPFQQRSQGPAHCTKCHKRLADAAPPGWSTTCPRCRTVNSVPLLEDRSEQFMTMLASREPPSVTVTPQITMAALDLSALENIAEESRRSAEFQAEQTEILKELLGRDQVVPQINYTPPEVTVTVPDPKPAIIQFPKPTPRELLFDRDEAGHIVTVREKPP